MISATIKNVMRAIIATLVLFCVPCRAAQDSWNQLLTSPDQAIPIVQIVSDYDGGRIHVVTARADLYSTADGASTWTAIGGRDAAGATLNLSIDPFDSNVLYRTTTTGVFKSTNGGLAWYGIDRDFPTSPLSVVVAPNARETVYVSIKADCRLGACDAGGIMKSEDAGITWSAAGLEGHSASIVVTDPQGTIYAIAARDAGWNVYKSADGGASWKAIFPGNTHVVSWLVHPRDPEVIYMTAWFQFHRLLYRSTNGGTTWTLIVPAIEAFQPPSCPPDTLDCIGEPMLGSIVADPRHPGVFYAADWRTVVRSNDGGITWQYLPGLPEETAVTTLTLDGDTLLAGVRGKTPGTTGVYAYTFSKPPDHLYAFFRVPSHIRTGIPERFLDESAGSITGWKWEFGDGASSGERHPFHRYTQSGTYDVTLTVTDGTGTHTATRRLDVSPSQGPLPPARRRAVRP